MTPRTLLLTRPQAQSEAFAAALEAALPGRFHAVIAPALRIAPVEAAIDLAGAQALLFTSANGVAAFAARSGERGLPAWCVGSMTAEVARVAGFAALSADGDAASLAALALRMARPEAGELVHVRGRHAAGDLTGRLAAAGLPARALEIYRQVPEELDAPTRALLDRGGVEVLTAFSPRSAGLFARAAQAAAWDLGGATLVALSAAAAAAHDRPQLGRRLIAPAPTRAGMIEALARL